MNNTELKQGLAHFTGTEHYFPHAISRMKHTDGVQFFAENAGGGAYWFLDIVGTELMEIHMTEPFVSITLKAENGQADIIASDGNDTQLFQRHIEFTDCPDGEWTFYLIDGILLLTGEY